MFKKQKRWNTGLMTGLITAAGAAGAFFGVRRLVRWFQQRQHDQQYFGRAQRRLVRKEGEPGIAVEEIGSSHQSLTQPDRQPIPATGVAEKEIRAAAQDVVERVMTNPPVADMVPQMVHYLRIFADMMEQIRARRQETGVMDAPHSLRVEDRNRFSEALDGLEGAVPDWGPGAFTGGSLQERIYRLTVKVRDAMKNIDYTDADLFRINGEVHTEACQLLDEIGPARMSASEEFEQVWRTYECGTD